jgi:hypothetical protein
VASKKSFPDLNKDGKVTKADILKGRGVEGFSEGGRIRRPAPIEEPFSDDPLEEALEQERRIREANPPKEKKPKPSSDDARFLRKKRTEEQVQKREKEKALKEKSENPRRAQKFSDGGMVRGCKSVQMTGKGFKGTF